MDYLTSILKMISEMVSSFKIQEGVTITSNSRIYHVEKISNVDQNSAVSAQCRIQETGEIVSLKCIPRTFLSKYKQEAKAFHYLTSLNADENNLIKVIEIFDFCDWACFAFEKLEMRLFDFMIRRKCEPLRINEIRVIAQQMFLALNELKWGGITHTKVKTENIMLVNHESQPFKVKLTGFGDAGRTSKLSELEMSKICGYSAPEVYLDCPLDQSLDTWSLGCTLAFLFLGFPLYPTNSDYEYMRIIVKLLGQPDQTLLDQGCCVNQFFTLNSGWRLKTPEEYVQETGKRIQGGHQGYDHLTSLDDLLSMAPEVEDPTEYEDVKAFVDLLKKMLTVNPEDRISPADALKHRFITMEPLPGIRLNSNVTEKHEIPAGGQLPNPDGVPEEEIQDLNLNLTDSKDEMEITTLTLKKGLKIIDQSNVYKVEEVLGSGSFGEVAKCRKRGTNEMVAIKFFRENKHLAAVKEVKAYKAVSKLDPNKNNLLKFIDSFNYKDCFCLVFELLDISLFDLIKQQDGTPLRVSEIRPIAQQMLVTLSALKNIGLTHTDIKPDNIMLVNQKSQPFKVKLIDFGLVCESSKLSQFQKLQAKAYRAPEVYLGLPRDEGIDMWGLGCTLAFLFLSKHLFPTSEYEVVRMIVKLFGQPDKDALDHGFFARDYFMLEQKGFKFYWRLKTSEEYQLMPGKIIKQKNKPHKNLESLDDFVKMAPDIIDHTEMEDIKALVDLLKKMLAVNPEDRISPADALKHRFITMEPLPGISLNSNVTERHEIPAGGQLPNPDGVPEKEIQNSNLHLTGSKDEMGITTLTLKKGLKIIDQSNVYKVEKVLGSGSFGEVAKCRKRGTNEMVAIKFFRENKYMAAVKEVYAYKSVSKLDPNKNNLLKFIDSFIYKDCCCLVFELLDISLYDFLKRQDWSPLRVSEIRPITQQMLVTLSALKNIGLTHTDIKPDNIMLVNQKSQPFKVKLIDFGLVCESSKLSKFQKLQAKAYRAPEVYLGLPRDEGIDMWGLGCTLAFLFLSKNLFPTSNEYEVVRMIVKLFGQPDKDTLDHGFFVRDFFTLEQNGSEFYWRLKTSEEYQLITGKEIRQKNPSYESLGSMDDFVKMAPDIIDHTDMEDIEAFVDLLKKMLAVNPEDRILPDDALKHRFITMEHLHGARNRPETTTQELRNGCILRNLDIVNKKELDESKNKDFHPTETSGEKISDKNLKKNQIGVSRMVNKFRKVGQLLSRKFRRPFTRQ